MRMSNIIRMRMRLWCAPVRRPSPWNTNDDRIDLTAARRCCTWKLGLRYKQPAWRRNAMPDDSAPDAGPLPAALVQMMTGYWVSQALYIAAKLGVADLLVDGPQSVAHLAVATRAHAASLRRVLRALASVGVFTETSPGAYALTPLAALLR